MALIIDQVCDCCGRKTPQVRNDGGYPYLCSTACKKRYKFGKCEIQELFKAMIEAQEKK